MTGASFPLGPVQRQWVEALRSGNYQQGKIKLRKNDSYCCLGVGCEMFLGDGTAKEPYVSRDDAEVYVVYAWEGSTASAPKRLVEILKLKTALGETQLHSFDYDEPDSLSSMNDHGKTFAEIADAIEANPSLWFTESA